MIALRTLNGGVVFIGPGTKLAVEESPEWTEVWVIAIHTPTGATGDGDPIYDIDYYACEYESKKSAAAGLNGLLAEMGSQVVVF